MQKSHYPLKVLECNIVQVGQKVSANMSNMYKMKYHIVIATACRRVCNTVTNTSKKKKTTAT